MLGLLARRCSFYIHGVLWRSYGRHGLGLSSIWRRRSRLLEVDVAVHAVDLLHGVHVALYSDE